MFLPKQTILKKSCQDMFARNVMKKIVCAIWKKKTVNCELASYIKFPNDR